MLAIFEKWVWMCCAVSWRFVVSAWRVLVFWQGLGVSEVCGRILPHSFLYASWLGARTGKGLGRFVLKASSRQREVHGHKVHALNPSGFPFSEAR